MFTQSVVGSAKASVADSILGREAQSRPVAVHCV
jgi:hypothetical protein